MTEERETTTETTEKVDETVTTTEPTSADDAAQPEPANTVRDEDKADEA